IFAIVMATMNTVFYSALRLRNKTAAMIEEKLPAQHTAAIIRSDLAGLVAPGGTIFGSLTTSATTGAMTSANDAENATVFYTASAVIDDTTPWAEVQRVSYYLADSADQPGVKDLIRSVSRNPLPVTDDLPVTQWLM